MGKDLKGRELGTGISQEKKGLYSARYVDRFGKRQQKRFKNLQEAKVWLTNAVYDDKHRNPNAISDMCLDAWYEYWVDIKKRSIRSSSIDVYQNRYELDVKYNIGHMLVSEVKALHCQLVFNKMADNGYSNKTISCTRNLLHELFEYAKDNEIISNNPCNKSLEVNVGKETSSKISLTKEQQKLFLNIAKDHKYENAFRFVLQTGLRAGELSGLRWEDIDFENKTIKVVRSAKYNSWKKEWIVDAPKTKNGYRIIALTDEAISILRRQKLSTKVAKIEWVGTIFLGDKGEPVKTPTYDLAMYTLCRRAGIPKSSMHILRHTFATRCIEAGMKPKVLQVIMGHSSIAVTMNLYVNVDEVEISKEMDMISGALMAL